jgi:hypothetical protein
LGCRYGKHPDLYLISQSQKIPTCPAVPEKLAFNWFLSAQVQLKKYLNNPKNEPFYDPIFPFSINS